MLGKWKKRAAGSEADAAAAAEAGAAGGAGAWGSETAAAGATGGSGSAWESAPAGQPTASAASLGRKPSGSDTADAFGHGLDQGAALTPPPQQNVTVMGAVATAAEATASALSVAALVVWTLIVTGWQGFQVVQNALIWTPLQDQEMPRQPLQGTAGSQTLWMELKGLWALIGIEAGLTGIFCTLSIALLWVPSINSCRSGTRFRRTKRAFWVWLISLVFIITAWFKVFTLSSVLNKLAYQGLWCSTDEHLDIKYTFEPEKEPPVPGCKDSSFVYPIRKAIVYALLSIGFHMLLFFIHVPKGIRGKALGLIPATLIAAALLVKPFTSMMNFHFTQLHYTAQGNFTFTSEMIVALIAFITAIWLALYMGWTTHNLRLVPRFTNTLLACCGKRYESVYYEEHSTKPGHSSASPLKAPPHATTDGPSVAEPLSRKSYSLRAATKSLLQQFYMLVQLPAVFGFVSPMITFFSLGITSFWIKFDVIAGAVIVAIYLIMCALHRYIMAPSK